MLVVMIGIRKSLDCIFTTRELKILDDIMPEMSRRAAAVEDLEQLSQLNDGREVLSIATIVLNASDNNSLIGFTVFLRSPHHINPKWVCQSHRVT